MNKDLFHHSPLRVFFLRKLLTVNEYFVSLFYIMFYIIYFIYFIYVYKFIDVF